MELKNSLACLYTLVIELAKHDYDENFLKSYMDDLGYANEKIKLFSEYFNVIRIYSGIPDTISNCLNETLRINLLLFRKPKR
jgi:hypothetical protein